jgi:hypothetical protein
VIVTNAEGETTLVIRQPYLEGMLPYEYSVILNALKQLEVTAISVFFEAKAVQDSSLDGHVHRVSSYFNKRFYKYSEEGREYLPEPGHHAEEEKSGLSLFVSEGNLLPSQTELSLAKKAKFDLYTITNLSFMDIAQYLSLKPALFAVARHDLGNLSEHVADLTGFEATSVPVSAEEPAIARREVHLPYDAQFDVTVTHLLLTIFSTPRNASMRQAPNSRRSLASLKTFWFLSENLTRC